MIKQFFAAAMLMAVTVSSASASNSNNIERIIRQEKLNTPVKKISIYGDADVTLTRDVSSVISIEGKPVSANGVKLVNQNGNLELRVGNHYGRSKPVIRIPVHQLEVLEVHGNGKVFTESFIRSAQLNVFLNGACEVSIRSLGNISVNASPDYGLNYIKNEKINIVPALN